MKPVRSVLISLVCLFAAGCASYRADLNSAQNLAKYQRYWVKSNFNDNHAIDQFLVRALKQRGFEAESGPLTMMPASAQVLVTYRDYWAWDFRNHIVGLEVNLIDARKETQLGAGNFAGAAALLTSPGEAVERVVRKIFNPKPKKA